MEPQVKKEHYLRPKYDDLNRFITYFYQIDLVRSLKPRSVVEIGVGNKTVSDYLKKLGLRVSTVDIDPKLKPDVVADIRNLPFGDGSFDVVLAYEVLEHLPYEEFEKALKELRRVSNQYVLISLPYRSTGFEVTVRFPLIRTLFKKSFLNFFLRVPLKFKGIESSGQHYWELDNGHYSLRKVRMVIQRQFKIIKELRPVLNYYHHFFILEKK